MIISKRGIFVTFEGPDGAGKTTQLRMLAEYLQEQGDVEILLTREPGGTIIGDKIRNIVLDPENRSMLEETEILLYAASRAQLVREKIIPALDKGAIVLCDRFVDASIAYQGFGLGRSPEQIAELNRFATGGLEPHRTYLLDLPAQAGRERLLKRNGEEFVSVLDRIEQKELHYHQKVREGFRHVAEMNTDRVKLIPADRLPTDIHEEIRDDFLSLVHRLTNGNPS